MTSTPISENDVAELPVHEDPYPSRIAMEAAMNLEIHSALGRVQTQTIGKVIQRAINAALASQSQERDAELLSLRKDFEIVRTASRLFEQAAHDGLERALKAERAIAEIRRAAIEECGKIVSRHLHSPEAILQAFQDIVATDGR